MRHLGESVPPESVFQVRLEFNQILRNDGLNNYYKANQHLNLTFIVPRHFSKP